MNNTEGVSKLTLSSTVLNIIHYMVGLTDFKITKSSHNPKLSKMSGFQAPSQYYHPQSSRRTPNLDGISYPMLDNYRVFDDMYAERNPLSFGPTYKLSPIVSNRDGTLTICLSGSGGTGMVEPDYNTLAAALRQRPNALLNIWISDWGVKTDYSIQSRVLSHHLQLIYANINRWNALGISAHLFNYLLQQNEWAAIRQKEAPNLKWLSIDNLDFLHREDIVPLRLFMEKIIMRQNPPNFEIASNTYEYPDVHRRTTWPMSWKYIHEIPFSWLRHLSLTTTISGMTVLDILKCGSSSLEEFFASDLIGPSPARGARPAHMPNLRSLSLYVGPNASDKDDRGFTWDLLQRISTVSIRELAIGFEDEWDRYAFDKFQDMIQSGNSLESLRLEEMSLSANDLKRCLARNNGLKELAVDFQSARRWERTSPIVFNQENCELICHEGCLPHLLTLVVGRSCIEDSGCFGRMVHALASRGLRNLAIVSLCTQRRSLNHLDLNTIRDLGINVKFMEVETMNS